MAYNGLIDAHDEDETARLQAEIATIRAQLAEREAEVERLLDENAKLREAVRRAVEETRNESKLEINRMRRRILGHTPECSSYLSAIESVNVDTIASRILATIDADSGGEPLCDLCHEHPVRGYQIAQAGHQVAVCAYCAAPGQDLIDVDGGGEG